MEARAEREIPGVEARQARIRGAQLIGRCDQLRSRHGPGPEPDAGSALDDGKRSLASRDHRARHGAGDERACPRREE